MLVDVGTDHGLLPLAAVSRGLAGRAIAIDQAAAPLEAAAENRRRAGLEAKLDLRLGSGLGPLGEESADALTLAGVGGRLAARILREGAPKLTSFQQLILQPNQEPAHVRRWAREAGWHLEAETMVEEAGRYFPVLAFRPGTGEDSAYAVPGFTVSELELLGPRLLATAHPVAARFAQSQHDRLARLHSPAAALWERATEAMAMSPAVCDHHPAQ